MQRPASAASPDAFGYSPDGSLRLIVDKSIPGQTTIIVLNAENGDEVRRWTSPHTVFVVGITYDNSRIFATRSWQDDQYERYGRLLRYHIDDGTVEYSSFPSNCDESRLSPTGPFFYVRCGRFRFGAVLSYDEPQFWRSFSGKYDFFAWGPGAGEVSRKLTKGPMEIISIETGQVTSTLNLPHFNSSFIGFTNNGRSIIVFKNLPSGKRRLYVMDSETNVVKAVSSDFVLSAATARGIITTCKKGSSKIDIRRYSLKKKRSIDIGRECGDHALSPDGAYLFTGIGEKWDVKTGKRVPSQH
jgi:hypothetical protein